MPRVSVLTPVYNTNSQHLRECIESILNQTFKDFEFLILNDSPENEEIEKIIKEYAAHDKRIKYSKNAKNIGITPSRNKLLDMAKGEYLAIFDHDDISLPTRLEKQVAYLDANPYVGCVSSNTEWFPKKHITNHPVNNLDIKVALIRANVVAHTAMMLRKSVLQKHNIKYEEDFSPAEDYMLCLRLIEYTMFHNIPEVLLKYRFQDDNTTNRLWEKMVNADALCKCVAINKYPYLYEKSHKKHVHSKWIKLFDFIPLVKIKYRKHKTRYVLFNILTIFSTKEKK